MRNWATRELDRKERAAIGALASAIEHEPVLRPVVVEDYARARRTIGELHLVLQQRLAAASRHPDEPGSKSTLPSATARCGRDGLAPYGSPDHTGFGEGCVY